jgi:broad specificity phosphatase PhoE
MKIFLIRHATPDWGRKDVPYDIHPGPQLSPKGEQEAEALAAYLKSEGVVRLYYSPFERAAQTAQLVAAANGISCVEDRGLAEWRLVAEPEPQVRQRMIAVFERAAKESLELGPIGLVSHGGPTALLLLALGINKDELATYRRKFDTTNPLPPAGAWKVERSPEGTGFVFRLAFTPMLNWSVAAD